ncbi:hypothetical protein AW878_17755 [Bordetella pseudohinzii]|uniref:Acyl-CoA dehydrogenase n=3 Tax=Bordetella pseudohinzii TaxID=1331258 RepID=A0ABM6DE82_9BORD|nr:hypothetical protein BBN53_09655 [Bordetella pseudohinzii]KMM25375.1 hypothetical protein L540_21130 [Bordetella pseudohinzii]KXA76555.1 hypothetical protein AW878_17755 [Bordetella pseudohinzii]KXA81264.1 hypothetical protein AW877_04880 [Bordetella pseudohinzii]
MNGMTEDQKALQEAAQRFLKDQHPPARARRACEASSAERQALWAELGAQGWPAMLVAEAQGGLGLGLAHAWPVAHAAGQYLLSLPLAAAMAVLPLLPQALDKDFAWADEDGLVEGAGAPALALRGQDLRRLPPAAQQAGLDPTMPLGWAEGEGEPLARLSAPQAEGLRARLRLLRLAEMLGAAEAALRMAVAYACERQQFGRPIGANQAIKHRLAEGWMALDDACLALDAAARAMDEGSDSGLDGAQWLAVDAARRCAHQAIQTHGAMGMTWECDAHLYLKRIMRLAAALEGEVSQDILLERIWRAAA